MSPRLESAVLTREDTRIWLHINLPLKRRAPSPFPSIGYFVAARRDAELMLAAQTAPLCECCQEQMSVVYFDGQPIDVRGLVRHP